MSSGRRATGLHQGLFPFWPVLYPRKLSCRLVDEILHTTDFRSREAKAGREHLTLL